jgi:hypothetical protein
MRPDEGRRVVGLARVFSASWLIVAGVVAETLFRIQHHYFFALLPFTADRWFESPPRHYESLSPGTLRATCQIARGCGVIRLYRKEAGDIVYNMPDYASRSSLPSMVSRSAPTMFPHLTK